MNEGTLGLRPLGREETPAALEALRESICQTLTRGPLPLERVLAACDALSRELTDAEYLPALLTLGLDEGKAREELQEARNMLRREYWETRLRHEFGALPVGEEHFVPLDASEPVTQCWQPLGVVLHIAAGNADALPAYSVLEGLMTGNINLLKLPGGDYGLSSALLGKLVAIDPLLADYVHVFDVPSQDMGTLKRLADLANAIVVWGGDAAVTAARQLARPDARLIEWGHRVSFAYVSGEVSDEALAGVAENICDTEQLYCSSCQGLYVDTDDGEELATFARRFLAVLDGVSRSRPRALPPGLQAQKTLELYTEELEAVAGGKQVLRTDRCSVTVYGDSQLSAAIGFRNCWVRPLPRARLLATLLPVANRLQSVALLCPASERQALEPLLLAAGAVRLSNGRNLSRTYCGQPHDGEYPLRRLMKRVSLEYGEAEEP